MSEAILVGDVGGTNARFAIAQMRGEEIAITNFQKLAGSDFRGFDDVLREYLASVDFVPSSACFALAGPVRDGEVILTNRRWRVSSVAVARQFGFKDVVLINDFTAMARSVPELPAENFETIIDGDEIDGEPIVVTGPGTGFGVATLCKQRDGRWHVLNGEGGHVAFSPRDDVELALHKVLQREFGYVSNELVASGVGLEAVHKAFCIIHGRDYEALSPSEMRREADRGDKMFHQLCSVRANTVMSVAGDLVLVNGALGGVVLAGGVTERIADYLKTAEARSRFEDRGALSHYVRGCHVKLLHNPEAPLIGAAGYFFKDYLL